MPTKKSKVIDARGLRSTIAPGETITVTIAKPLEMTWEA